MDGSGGSDAQAFSYSYSYSYSAFPLAPARVERIAGILPARGFIDHGGAVAAAASTPVPSMHTHA